MNVYKGLIVRAAAGRDSGGLFVIVRIEDKYCFIADGKSRKLESPKRKNPKHLVSVGKCADMNNMTNKKLKKLLSEYSKPT